MRFSGKTECTAKVIDRWGRKLNNVRLQCDELPDLIRLPEGDSVYKLVRSNREKTQGVYKHIDGEIIYHLEYSEVVE